MSSLYLIRHGQAGSRENYDLLSEQGKQQAARLGDYLRENGIRFAAAYCGRMRRQRETAEAALARLPEAPEIHVEPRWNEFSLEGLWEHMGPKMLAADADFARDYERLHSTNPGVDRVITHCDVQLIRAWIRGDHPTPDVEPWAEFRERVEATREELLRFNSGENIAVFTSATPTGIWCGNAFSLEPRQMLRIAAVLYNTSFSTLRLRKDDLMLFSLNQTPHLDPGMRTFR
ncbi:MAG: histidine phosphatase family protein [Bryobacteraceae bacterium]